MTATRAPVILAVAALVSLALWPVQIDSAFGLPAHPLLLHVPVVFVPILSIAALFTAARQHRHAVPLAAFAVVTLISTLLAAGAGEAFKDTQEKKLDPGKLDTLEQHAEAGDFLRWLMVLLTAALIATTFRLPKPARITVRILIVLIAIPTLIWVIRTGHLGSQVAWET